ncbi:rhomboid family intramembrane serine protease [Myroides sp. LJL115]
MKDKANKLFLTKRDLINTLVLIGVLWLFFILQKIGLFSGCYGVIPYHLSGLKGILLAPVFHGDFAHLLSNCAALAPLCLALFLFYRFLAWKVFFFGWLLSGLFLWLWPEFIKGTASCHIGASGLIYMLVSFLFFAGLYTKKIISLIVSLAIGLIYYSLVFGLFPNDQLAYNISWQAHLCGAIAGLVLARYFCKTLKKQNSK